MTSQFVFHKVPEVCNSTNFVIWSGGFLLAPFINRLRMACGGCKRQRLNGRGASVISFYKSHCINMIMAQIESISITHF